MKWCKCLPCTKVNEEDITTLDFSCSLLMEVPAMVFNYERTLQYLYLDSNKILELPRTLFQCEELRYLGLCDNEIETIPPLIEKLTNLESLLLSRNCLVSESIPANIHRCQKLKILHLSSNSITKVPGSITRLVSLRELYLNNCDLDFLPANFGRLNSLQILELRENNLATLPKSLKRLSDLQRLDISSNMFKKFPEVIATMTNLTELWLNDNFIIDIPDGIGALHKLSHFDASCNRLQIVTNSLGLCTSMTLLLFSMNDLKELPPTIGHLPLLHTLKLDHNFIESLPSSIGNLSNLEELDVQYNNLKSFPNSIGMLRKLNSLVAAQNSIAYLPSEIGSCTALSVLSLHYNTLMYLPQEMGHLQNLTSISLINNQLQYLPITILSLKKLKALWLSHNQSQPLITLQTETLQSGQLVLVCVFLPQVEASQEVPEVTPTVVSTGRRIGFKEPSAGNDLPARLSRIPTPHPKAFVKYQRTLEATFRRSQEGISQNVTPHAVYVKEANIVPMKGSTEESVITPDETVQKNSNGSDSHFSACDANHSTEERRVMPYNELQRNSINSSNNNDVEETRSECIGSISSGRIPSSLDNATENILPSDNTSENLYISGKSSVSSEKEFQCSERPKQPPPYHIAAAYSKTAHLFTNVRKTVKAKPEPKHFTQDQPSNILIPQPKHALCIQQYENMYNNKHGELVPYLSDDIQINEKVLKVTASLLILDYQQYRHLIEEFVLLKNVHADTLHCAPNNVFHMKLEILQTALYLVNNQNSFNFQKKYLIRALDNLLDYLEVIENWPNYAFENDFDSETCEKLYCLQTATILLQADPVNMEYQDVIDQLLHIKKMLLHNDSTDSKFEIYSQNMLQAKFHLIQLMIYFLTLSTNNKEYKYILGKLMQVQRSLEHINKTRPKQNRKDIVRPQNDLQRDTDYVEMTNGCHLEHKQRANINWLFGAHKNRKILKIELTPCCYVLGFTFNYSDEGVFIEEVDNNGNAHQKLFPGDKILMLDDRDISKMDAEDAIKAVQVWGPETETFLVSRN